MRKSQRLKSSETLKKLSEDQFAFLSTELDEDQETFQETFNKTTDNRGSKKKPANKAKFSENEDSSYETETEDSIVTDNESSLSELENSTTKKTLNNSTAGKKKIKRIGGYTPQLEQFPGPNGNILSSSRDWKEFISETNSNIKRKNRRYKTIFANYSSTDCSETQEIAFSSYESSILVNQDYKPILKVIIDKNLLELGSSSVVINGKFGFFNTGLSNSIIRFCECTYCKSNSDSFLLFVGSNKIISVLKAKVSKKMGPLAVEAIGSILPPKSELFNSICINRSVMSISTNRSLFFIDCANFHNQNSFRITLNESKTQVPDDISCHAWRGKNIALGTLSGRLFVFNTQLKEIFQLSVIAEASIFSLDWIDEYKIIIGGNFPKIFCIDVRDPFIVETKASTLAILPKVLWSSSLDSILFADGENHARRLEKDSSSFLHQPIGTFDSMVLEMGSSSFHNIIANSCASGSIHLSWMPEDSGYGVELEKKIFTLNINEDGNFEVDLVPSYVSFQVQDGVKLYSSNLACSSLAWSPNENFPGLLVAGYRNGLLVLIATDRFFI